MTNHQKFKILLVLILTVVSCKQQTNSSSPTDHEITMTPLLKAEKQMELLLAKAEEANNIPRTINEDGSMHWIKDGFDWTEGFFPGSLWYLYEHTQNEKWRMAAEKYQGIYEAHKDYTAYHDLGFIFNCSYGNGYRITESEHFKAVLINAGDSLITRFNPEVGCIKSWDVDKGWQSKRNWKFPVIVDNMMNLELLFELSKMTGNPKYQNIAVAHANTTLKNHFRQDNSSYHVVDYDPETGEVRNKETAQGSAHESSWARGQAWGLYGYTISYRYTKDKNYLEQAQKIADYIVENSNIPEDGIPFWDYNVEKTQNTPRDASAAAITVSALIELDGYTVKSYKTAIDNIMTSLGSSTYTAQVGKNQGFILKHSTGSLPHGAEIDVPLIYADYYYIEALLRYQKQYPSK